MNTRKTIRLATILALTVLILPVASAGAHASREFLGSFGSFEEPAGIAVDLQTGNVYVTNGKTQTVEIFGPTGGSPADGVPKQITGLNAEARSKPWGISVDNSCYEHKPQLTGSACEEYDPSYGDVYVASENKGHQVQKFRLSPKKEYELVGEVTPAGGVQGVGVDPQGNIYTASYFEVEKSGVKEGWSPVEFKKIVKKVINGGVEEVGETLEEIVIPQKITRSLGYVAADDLGDVYVSAGKEEELVGEFSSLGVAKLKVDGAGNLLSEEILAGFQEGTFRPLAVDSSTNAVFVGNGPEISEYDATGALLLRFGSTEPQGGSLGKIFAGVKGIAVNGPAERIYVVNPAHESVDVFGPVIGPPVIETAQPPASSVARTSALVAGSANPESGQATYYFQYVADGEYEPAASDPYREGGRTAIRPFTGGHTTETVERVALSGLQPGTTYHYRMVVNNPSGIASGPDETFTTLPATPPVAITGQAGDVTATGVTLSGIVGPRGLPTSYVFEIGGDTSYGGAKLFGNAGSSTEEVPVTVSMAYLAPGTTYHYRLVATSFDGTIYGQDGTFTTVSVPSSITQPASIPLVVSPVLGFPSIAGAITQPRAKPGQRTGSQQKLTHALKACHGIRVRKRRSRCEARAHKRYRGAAQSKGRRDQ